MVNQNFEENSLLENHSDDVIRDDNTAMPEVATSSAQGRALDSTEVLGRYLWKEEKKGAQEAS